MSGLDVAFQPAFQDPRAGAVATDFLSLSAAYKLKSNYLLYLGEEKELDMWRARAF